MSEQSELPPNERPQVSHSQEMTTSERPAQNSEWGRRRHRDGSGSLSAIFWAAMLIMAGLVFLADNTGLLPQFGSGEPWDWIMLGAGGLLLIGAFIRAVSPDFAAPGGFSVILGFVLVVLGASEVFGFTFGDFTNWWPLILIAIGLASLLKAIRA